MLNEDGEFVGLCPVCEARAFTSEGWDHEWCGNCGWIGGGLLPDDYSVYQGARHMTLEQAQENYRRFGCIQAPDNAPSKPMDAASAAAFTLQDELNGPLFRPRRRGRGLPKGKGGG